MFYSNTYLARKGPLGTVWMAAHLHHKLRKHLVNVTNIPTTVDYIMIPEVPIALRLSAHLLLGVVRIYSKKVDYLFDDCNLIFTRMRTLLASIHEINLPEDATCAPFHSITLPETFELDALDLDDASYQERVLDNHTSTSEEITLTDQIPGEADPYVTFFINEDIQTGFLPAEETPDTGVRPMDEDASTSGVNSGRGDTVPVSFEQPEEFNQSLFEDRFHEALPEIEVMRDAVNIFGSLNDEQLLGFGNDVTEQHGPLHQIMNEKIHLSPVMEDMPTLGGQSLSPQLHADPPSVSALPETHENFNISASPGFGLGNNSLELAIQPTPPVEKQNPKPRKRKQGFDTCVVLSNQFMKEGLNDPSGLVRKRNKLPCSALDVWKFHKRSRTDQVFLESSISGLCEELQNLSKKEFSKVHIIPIADTNLDASETVHIVNTHQEATVTAPVEDSRGANSPTPMTECNTEVEHLLFDGYQDPGSSLLEFTSSPFRGDETTPLPSSNMISEPPASSIMDTEPLPTFERTASTQPIYSDMETPNTRFDFDHQFGTVGSNLSDIPELMNSAEGEDLWFLDADNTPAAEQTENEVHALSARTRAVAQYLKDQSPTTVVSKDHTASLNLNTILGGKTRKKCGRMFFETLVLKSYGYIDVQQEEPYGDITLLLDPLSTSKF